MTELERRIYYQNIVYDICNMIDSALGGVTVCGTCNSPSTEVQDRLREILSNSEQS